MVILPGLFQKGHRIFGLEESSVVMSGNTLVVDGRRNWSAGHRVSRLLSGKHHVFDTRQNFSLPKAESGLWKPHTEYMAHFSYWVVGFPARQATLAVALLYYRWGVNLAHF